MLPSATALKLTSHAGVVGWLVRCGVDPLLIGSALRRVSRSGLVVLAGVFQPPARFLDYYGLC